MPGLGGPPLPRLPVSPRAPDIPAGPAGPTAPGGPEGATIGRGGRFTCYIGVQQMASSNRVPKIIYPITTPIVLAEALP